MPPIPGRTDITDRALSRTVGAIAADQLGVPMRSVGVSLNDDGGMLGIAIDAPVAIGANSSPGIVTGAQAVRSSIRESITRTVDREVGRLSLRLTRAIIATPRRVK